MITENENRPSETKLHTLYDLLGPDGFLWRFEQRSREPGYQWGELTFCIPVRDGFHAQRQIDFLKAEFAKMKA